MVAKEQIFRKRYLVLKYNVVPHTKLGGMHITSPWTHHYFGSLSHKLWYWHHYARASAGEQPHWTTGWQFGQKKPNYMMWSVGEGGHNMWGHSWQKYRVSDMTMVSMDLRGPEPY
eukprot:TRINITY_DN48481_c0_g1_i1.p1 TRINITY_DN48481_c0_g1~~TRINITY_DN48481_c0_g1_i1.p1  ORF type:complete len:115 (+),score=5.79 TRINITY_DN48481_c0_g1_i1:56-400(+)